MGLPLAHRVGYDLAETGSSVTSSRNQRRGAIILRSRLPATIDSADPGDANSPGATILHPSMRLTPNVTQTFVSFHLSWALLACAPGVKTSRGRPTRGPVVTRLAQRSEASPYATFAARSSITTGRIALTATSRPNEMTPLSATRASAATIAAIGAFLAASAISRKIIKAEESARAASSACCFRPRGQWRRRGLRSRREGFTKPPTRGRLVAQPPAQPSMTAVGPQTGGEPAPSCSHSPL